jgi:hypothetical protein
LLSRFEGAFLLRFATRAFSALLIHDPPRTTRLEPSFVRARSVARRGESGQFVPPYLICIELRDVRVLAGQALRRLGLIQFPGLQRFSYCRWVLRNLRHRPGRILIRAS